MKRRSWKELSWLPTAPFYNMAILYFIVLILFVLIFGTMIWASLSAAPWLPSWKKDVLAVVKSIEIKSTDIVYDLGCGDGRWLFAVAKTTPAKEIVGFEISLLFYVWCRIKILFSSYPHLKVKYQDLFKADLSQADVVFCFLLPRTMIKIKDKLEKEMKPNSLFVSYTFTLPGHQPEKTFKVSQKSLPIYFYRF